MDLRNNVSFCICHSKNTGEDIIGCEKCGKWFHLECVLLTKEAADEIDDYYCYLCRSKDPLLTITYLNRRDIDMEIVPRVSQDSQGIELICERDVVEDAEEEDVEREDGDNDSDFQVVLEKICKEADGDDSNDEDYVPESYSRSDGKRITKKPTKIRKSKRLQRANEDERVIHIKTEAKTSTTAGAIEGETQSESSTSAETIGDNEDDVLEWTFGSNDILSPLHNENNQSTQNDESSQDIEIIDEIDGSQDLEEVGEDEKSWDEPADEEQQSPVELMIPKSTEKRELKDRCFDLITRIKYKYQNSRTSDPQLMSLSMQIEKRLIKLESFKAIRRHVIKKRKKELKKQLSMAQKLLRQIKSEIMSVESRDEDPEE